MPQHKYSDRPVKTVSLDTPTYFETKAFEALQNKVMSVIADGDTYRAIKDKLPDEVEHLLDAIDTLVGNGSLVESSVMPRRFSVNTNLPPAKRILTRREKHNQAVQVQKSVRTKSDLPFIHYGER